MSSKEELQNRFNPGGPGIKGSIFGLPFTPDSAEVVLIPVPWEVTATYGEGTALAPQAILDASVQMDHMIPSIHDAWKLGTCLLPIPEKLLHENQILRSMAVPYMQSLGSGEEPSDNLVQAKINEASENLNIYIKNLSLTHLNNGKLVGLVGGDHSTPLGLLRALSEKHERYGVLQVDAHADLRKAYQGFSNSHASIMFNALKLPAITKLVQVGIRDYCEEELHVMQRAMGRVNTFFDADIKEARYQGKTWASLCQEIIKELPPLVYISFDMDGLNPSLCPHTGTPVPGGFEFEEMVALLRQLVKSGKKIIGFDLTETGASEWDANVGARMLFQLCSWMGVSQGKLKLAH